jgi:dTDP-4-amino-4,6-dideoxygalactose transaminase
MIPRFRPSLPKEALLAIAKNILFVSLRSNSGQEINEFEEKFAEYIGVGNAISVPSGRAGLLLILNNLGLEKNSQVILPAFTYWAVPSTISLLKFEPVFADIDSKTCNLDVSQVEKKITKFTKVILPTHLYGLPCNMDEVTDIAKRYNLLIIEDCVQACGAEYAGRKVGSFGQAAYFSFGITKNFSLLGGGMVVTNNDNLAKKIREEVSSYGILNKRQLFKRAIEALAIEIFSQPLIFSLSMFPMIYLNYLSGSDIVGRSLEEKEEPPENLRRNYPKLIPPGLQARLGLEQLMRLDTINDKRIKNANFLLEKFEKLDGVLLPPLAGGNIKNVFTNFPIRSKNRNFLAKELIKKGIDTTFGYMRSHDPGCPNAVELEQSILHLPAYPSLNEEELLYICQTVKDIFKKAKSRC